MMISCERYLKDGVQAATFFRDVAVISNDPKQCNHVLTCQYSLHGVSGFNDVNRLWGYNSFF